MFGIKKAPEAPRLRSRNLYKVDGEPFVAVVYDYTEDVNGLGHRGLDLTFTLFERALEDPVLEWEGEDQWYASGEEAASTMNGLLQQWAARVQEMLDARADLEEFKAGDPCTIFGYPDEELYELEMKYGRRLQGWRNIGSEIYIHINRNLAVPDRCNEELVCVEDYEVRSPTAFREKT